ncbi:hypothetical protein E2C01_010105 [Portunus trituberculatus]|uniref:Uncharacterized protein n=1 Tax=Portunus trituberculatus TaxID=210409 RepID=A0A5B7D7L0_PORTR|nr:hypothetical protein [Portunus trituberculatus]
MREFLAKAGLVKAELSNPSEQEPEPAICLSITSHPAHSAIARQKRQRERVGGGGCDDVMTIQPRSTHSNGLVPGTNFTAFSTESVSENVCLWKSESATSTNTVIAAEYRESIPSYSHSPAYDLLGTYYNFPML